MPPINDLFGALRDAYGEPDLTPRETPEGTFIGYGHPVNTKLFQGPITEEKASTTLYDDMNQALGQIRARFGHAYSRMDTESKVKLVVKSLREDFGVDVRLGLEEAPPEPEPEPVKKKARRRRKVDDDG